MGDVINTGQLRAFVERIERIEADIKELNADKSEVYKELRACGYDVRAVRAVVAKRKLDTDERAERDAMFDLYWTALNGSPAHVHTRTRENIEEIPASDGQNNPCAPPAPVGSAAEEIPTPVQDADFEPPQFLKREHEWPDIPERLRRAPH